MNGQKKAMGFIIDAEQKNILKTLNPENFIWLDFFKYIIWNKQCTVRNIYIYIYKISMK